MLNIELTKNEIIVLNELYVYFRQTGEWCGVRTINSKFGRDLLSKISSYQPALLQVDKDRKDEKSIYKLTFEGIYLCPKAKNDLDLLKRYLQLLIDKFRNDPEIKKISSMEVESSLKINAEESRVLRDLIMIGYFCGGSSSHAVYWEVGVPDDIEDLVELGPDKYIKKHRQKFWKTNEKVDNIIKIARDLTIPDESIADLKTMHPQIYTKCYDLYKKGAYAEAVEKSFKVVRDKLRKLTGYERGSDAFGKGKLHIKGAAAPHVDCDFNNAVKFLTMAIDQFRNEKSHTSDAQIEDPIRAYEYLRLSSLAMNLLENAEILS